MKRTFSTLAGLILTGCAAPDLSGITSPITALTATASNTVALEQELADQLIKESAEIYFLSKGSATCLDNSSEGLKIMPYTRVMAYRTQEEAYLKLRLADLYTLAAYADSLTDVLKERDQRYAEMERVRQLIDEGAKIAAYVPEFGAEAKPVNDAAAAVAGLIKNGIGYEYDKKLLDKAKKMRPKINDLLGRLEDRFHIVGDRAQLYVNAWRACTRAKFVYIRDKMPSVATPVSVVELDSNYGSFRAQYRDYLNRIPHIDKDAFEKIRKANDAMLSAPTLDEFAKSAQNLAELVGQLVSTYKTVKDSARQIFGT